MSVYTIRQAGPEDCVAIAELIKGLAEYEKLSSRVSITPEVLRQDGFGDSPFFRCKVAVVPDNAGSEKLVAYALYFPIYSTFEGRALYLEDIYVDPESRGKGIGTELWRLVAKEALQIGCRRLDFQVLSWNTRAIDLYKSRGAVDITQTDNWHVFRMNHEALNKFAAGS